MDDPPKTIRRLMGKYGWRECDLADIMGIRESTLSDYLQGKVPIPLSVSIQLSKIFGYTPYQWAVAEAKYKINRSLVELSDDYMKCGRTDAMAYIYKTIPVRKLRVYNHLTNTRDPDMIVEDLANVIGIKTDALIGYIHDKVDNIKFP